MKAEIRAGRPYVFGIRHLSPAGAWYLRQVLDERKPELILVEGPSDFNELMEELASPEVQPPFAVMAYTKALPVRTILYPFAVYSPEYQAIRWAAEHHCPCRFCDLPSEVFLGLEEAREKRRAEKEPLGNETPQSGPLEEENPNAFVYRSLDKLSEDGSHETFWERTMEHAADWEGYQRGAAEFGRSLRSLTLGNSVEDAENLVREAYMSRVIQDAAAEGVPVEKILVVTGAYHVDGILRYFDRQETGNSAGSVSGPDAAIPEGSVPGPMSDRELARLPRLEVNKTLMPYSYYRLSERSGYGAGNKAPAYYELVWDSFCRNEPGYGARRYLAGLAGHQRKQGNLVSSAEVIEAVRLAFSLAELHGGKIPALADVRDAAVTCIGHGKLAEIAVSVAQMEIGTRIGSLPQGVSRTSIQNDFYRKLEELRLEKYRSVTAQMLPLDLREKLTVQSRKAAFLDLERSFFLHRLRVLGIRFASFERVSQENATWAERWNLMWTPEAEIQLVEAVLKGDTVEQAAAFVLKERMGQDAGIGELAGVIRDACLCGMPAALTMAVDALQASAVDAASVPETASAAGNLSAVIQYGDIRKLDHRPLIPILSQLFLRVCLILPGECACDDSACRQIGPALELMNEISVRHDFLDGERFGRVLGEIAERDDLNTKLSGLAAAILLERGEMDSQELGRQVERRLSKGIPADLGAGWFEGLSMRNHYALIARLSLWEKLNDYLDTLDDEEFKRALVFLRRAFADYSAAEKEQIAENLGEIWNVNPEAASEILNGSVPEDAAEFLEGLDEFDFGDI